MEERDVEIITEDEAFTPYYASDGASGADVRACIDQPITLEPGESQLISTGIKLGIPRGYEIQIRPRSGLAYKHQITVLNTPATIDADYRGEIKVLLINHGKTSFLIEPRMRIAQIVLAPVARARFTIKESLLATARGESGFGHTGTH